MSDRIGVDAGALFLKAVRLNGDGAGVLAEHCERHHGRPAEALGRALAALGATDRDRVGVTGCHGEALAAALGAPFRDVTVCQLEAVRLVVPDARAVMDVGGASATLVTLDERGRFQGHATNSLCAAGTGSFLDEQAGRLGLTYAETAAFEHNPDPPSVAARCSVFAKSDLIHRQQEGHGKRDMWCGLCRGMTRTLLGTLLAGRPLPGRTALIGGVARNAAVVRWLEEACPGLITVPERPHLVAAVGAALHGERPSRGVAAAAAGAPAAAAIPRFPWTLTLERSRWPSFATEEAYETADGSEVRVTRWPAGPVVRGFLGIDIGSTSTKAALCDANGDVLADVYRKTAGDPIGATKLLFGALRALAAARGAELEILGAGTTGSGRKIVGAVIGADAVVNEISAHVAGAARVDPAIDTIFEIGGQDAKYMHLVDGHIRDASMNYVCAAGTGSFVEEQAAKLGYRVAEAGPAVLGVRPPRATDRCTVFMEQDMAKLIQAGAAPREAFAAVMVAVVRNYLNKVVGSRHRSRDRVFFQGATARNPALVAAFERLLGVEVVVSPYCHVMGAWGVALLTRERLAARPGAASGFRGLDLERRAVRLGKEGCALCQNRCSITVAEIEGVAERPSWGYQCGREPGERRVRANPRARLLERRRRLWREAGALPLPETAPAVGVPQALSTWAYLPLWRRFLNRLGWRVELSGPTTPAVRELGARVAGAEFCFPAKVLLGHAATLAARGGTELLLLPQLKHEVPNEHVTASAFCPYVQGAPGYVRAAFALNGLGGARILAPIVDLRLPERRLVAELARELGGPLGRGRREIAAAWREALGEQRAFEEALRAEGRAALAEARERGERLLLLVGRPYNLYDAGLNLGLPEKLAEQGRTVLPLDLLAPDLARLGARHRNMYWGYGQKILAALAEAAAGEELDAVYFTNFGCGPDSFLLSYAAEIMGAKPFLALELDEHGSDTGYLTRIEAFFDVLRRPRRAAPAPRPPAAPPAGLAGRTVWVPNMHPHGTEFFAAALRRHGFAARALPLETEATFELGRSVTRGSECLPTALTIGSLLAAVRAAPGERHAFFMPTAQGPCRFGQYVTLHRQILDREGHGDVPILGPSHFKGFEGLEEPVRRTLWKAMVAGDVLLKAGCRVRPYEREEGAADRAIAEEEARIAAAIEAGGDVVAAVGSAVRRLAAVPTRPRGGRPLVGVVGEIYVRNNVFANEGVMRAIERHGGEAWMVPVGEWILYCSSLRTVFSHHDRRPSGALVRAFLKWRWLRHWERRFLAAASPLLDDRHEPDLEETLAAAEPWIRESVGGEADLTVGRAVVFARRGAAMVVNVAPFGCMPGTITTAIFGQVSAETGMPIVNLFYDGTGAQNRRLAVSLRTLAARA